MAKTYIPPPSAENMFLFENECSTRKDSRRTAIAGSVILWRTLSTNRQAEAVKGRSSLAFSHVISKSPPGM
jgi:hypothetical protein